MGRAKSIAAWALQVLLSALFLLQGVSKLLSSASWVARFKTWGYPDGFYFVVGATELLCALMLLIPRIAGVGAMMLMVVMAGATVTHLAHGEPQVITTLVLMALLGLVVYIRVDLRQLREGVMQREP